VKHVTRNRFSFFFDGGFWIAVIWYNKLMLFPLKRLYSGSRERDPWYTFFPYFWAEDIFFANALLMWVKGIREKNVYFYYITLRLTRISKNIIVSSCNFAADFLVIFIGARHDIDRAFTHRWMKIATENAL
jgi:hypothetical protein